MLSLILFTKTLSTQIAKLSYNRIKVSLSLVKITGKVFCVWESILIFQKYMYCSVHSNVNRTTIFVTSEICTSQFISGIHLVEF